MTLLPIVGRELRLAARRRASFWLRVVAALVALAIGSALFSLLVLLGGGLGIQPGAPLFATLTWLAFVLALSAGLFFTSDCLSEEKRDGTLGFLFLTDLRGYDVVLGKLLATSCRCVFALLAIFPILACTQLFGGVETAEFWGRITALAHTLFFSLVVGIFVSAISFHPQKALMGTLLLMFLLLGGVSMFDAGLAWISNLPFRHQLGLISPVVLFLNGDFQSSLFWPALLGGQMVAWGLLLAASLLAPRLWQVKVAANATHSPWRIWWRYGNDRQRKARRSKWLANQPLAWLATRERWQARLVWLMVGLLATGFLFTCYVWSDDSGFQAWSGISFLAVPLLYLWVASQACQIFADLRRTGMIELMLATPIRSSSVADDVWRGLARLFAAPILVVVVIFALASAMGGYGGGLAVGSMQNEYLKVFFRWGAIIVGAGVTMANFVAVIWFGLWMGLVSRNGLLATLKTIAFVQVLPTLVIWYASALVIPLIMLAAGGWGGSGGIWLAQWVTGIMWALATGLTLLKDWLFWRIARRNLTERFRATAVRAVLPVVRYVHPSRALNPIPAPPVIPMTRSG